MGTIRFTCLACLLGAGLAGVAAANAAPLARHPGGSVSSPRPDGGMPNHRGIGRHGSHRGAPHVHWRGGHWGHSHHWGWGLGLAVGVPWILGWHEPWWRSTYYPPYAYGPVYRRYGDACERDEDCWRERHARSEPAPPTTEVAPAAPGEEGGPTQRPLHLNYCDASKAWFPHVRTCAGGWRLVRPDYGAGS